MGGGADAPAAEGGSEPDAAALELANQGASVGLGAVVAAVGAGDEGATGGADDATAADVSPESAIPEWRRASSMRLTRTSNSPTCLDRFAESLVSIAHNSKPLGLIFTNRIVSAN